jgi:SAM-dependent methyltransferase
LDAVWHGIGAQLRNPSGLWGRLTGRAMALVNARPNALCVSALRLKAGESVLELGCGPGLAVQRLIRLPELELVIGIDWSEVMLAQAARRNRAALEAGRLALVRGDFARLPFGDAIADAVLAVNAAYFMPGSAALREAHRVLRTGGRIVLYATEESAMRRWPFAGPDTHRLFDRDSLAALLLDAGFPRNRIGIDEVDAGFGVAGLVALAHKDGSTGPPP